MPADGLIPINLIASTVLSRFNAKQIVLATNRDLGEKVLATTSLQPAAMHAVEGLGALAALREQEGIFGITVTVIQLDRDAIEEATSGFEQRFRLLAELD